MRVKIIGAGWYGCHLAASLLAAGHKVTVHERAPHIFAGASGANPARLHQGFHYPRSAATRAACREHASQFFKHYGDFTRGVPVNVYAVAARDSLLDFATFRKVLAGEAEFLPVNEPEMYGLENVEGAVLTAERHIVIADVRAHFENVLRGALRLGDAGAHEAGDVIIDCTFCAQDAVGVGRFEPCITVLLEGPTNVAVTVMDGPFPSLYPWNENQGLSSLTSASLTPFARCQSYADAQAVLDGLSKADVRDRASAMLGQMATYYPRVRDDYRIIDARLSIRAQPHSGSDARLCEVRRTGSKTLRVRAGKIDAVFHAEREVKRLLKCWPSEARLAA